MDGLFDRAENKSRVGICRAWECAGAGELKCRAGVLAMLSQGLDDEEGEGASLRCRLTEHQRRSSWECSHGNSRLASGPEWRLHQGWTVSAQVLLPCRRLQDPGASMRLTLSRCEACVASFLVLGFEFSVLMSRRVSEVELRPVNRAGLCLWNLVVCLTRSLVLSL
jgi:hypothetical protein